MSSANQAVLAAIAENNVTRIAAVVVPLAALAAYEPANLEDVGVVRVESERAAGALRLHREVVDRDPFGEAVGLPAGVRDWEPPVALFSADEGMSAIRMLLASAPTAG